MEIENLMSVPKIANSAEAVENDSPLSKDQKEVTNYAKKKSSVKDRVKTVVCRLISTEAGCKFGDKCKFLHTENVVKRSPKVENTQDGVITVLKGTGTDVYPNLVVGSRVCSDLGEFFANKTVACSSKDEALSSLVQNHPNVACLAAWRPVPHPCSHLFRELACLMVLISELRNLKVARVASIYGAERDIRLAKLTGRAKNGDKLVCEEGMQVTVDVGPDETYPGDAGKTCRRVEFTGLYDCVYAVDIYWDGKRGAVTPATVAKWCLLSRKREVFIITRMFSGYMGCDRVAKYTGNVEGVWFRSSDGMINFSPDEANFGYPKHHDVDWLRQKSVSGLSCTYISTAGPFEIIKVCMDGPLVVPVPVFNQDRALGIVDKIDVPHPGLYPWVLRKIGVEPIHLPICSAAVLSWTTSEYPCLVHNATLAALRPVFQLKAGAGHNMDMAVAMVKSSIMDDKTLVEVSKRYPRVVEEVIVGTADAVLFSSKTETANRYGGLRSGHMEAETQIVEARAPSMLLPPARYKRALIAGLILWGLIQFGLTIGVHGHITFNGEVVDNSNWWGGLIVVGIFVLAHVVHYRRNRYRKTGLWKAWRDAHDESKLMEEYDIGYEDLPAGSIVKSVQVKSMTHDVGAGTIKILVDGTKRTPHEAFDLLKDEDPVKVCWVVAATNGMLFQPDRSDVNLLAAVVQRLHVKVNKADQEAWNEAYSLIDEVITMGSHEPWILEKCAEVMGGVKGKNLLESWKSVERGHITVSKKNVTVKWNETICTKMIDGEMSIKPRSIVVLSNELHSWFSPDARGFSDALHVIFNGRSINGVKVYYASGYSGKELDAIGSHLYGYEDFIAVSGDDSICCFRSVLTGVRRMFPLLEGDFTAMDQSEKTEAINLHARVMRKLGLPEYAVDFYVHVCGMPYKARGKRITIKGDVGTQLATGIDYTTACNSLTTIVFWMLAHSKPTTDPKEVAASLGLTLKLKSHSTPMECTFLKGWWQPCKEGGVAWFPLPSQTIKLGKIMRDPKLFSEKRDLVDGIRSAAWAISQSMPNLPRNYPVLGPFLAMLERNGSETKIVVSASEDGWHKPNVSEVSIDRNALLQATAMRYNITEDSIIDCERLMNQVDRLPVFISHPVFEAFMMVDYY